MQIAKWASLVAQMVKNLPALQETWVQSSGWKDPLMKRMASYSSTLAWEIPWIQEPGGLQSMGPQRIGHDSATSTHTHTHTHTHIQRSRGEPELESKTNPICYFCTTDSQREGEDREGEGEIERHTVREIKGRPLHMLSVSGPEIWGLILTLSHFILYQSS